MPEAAPFIPFRFQVKLFDADGVGPLARAAFSEVAGLEASMEPKTLKEGGRNYGERQFVGTTSFATVVLKRGVTDVRDLWTWFESVNRGNNYGQRLEVAVEVQRPDGGTALRWRLQRALPVKFKAPDLSATASEAAIEELHLVHEGLHLEDADNDGGGSGGG